MIFLAAAWLKQLLLMQMKEVAVDRWAQQLIVIHGIAFWRQTAWSLDDYWHQSCGIPTSTAMEIAILIILGKITEPISNRGAEIMEWSTH